MHTKILSLLMIQTRYTETKTARSLATGTKLVSSYNNNEHWFGLWVSVNLCVDRIRLISATVKQYWIQL
jgi:hypothetical protein